MARSLTCCSPSMVMGPKVWDVSWAELTGPRASGPASVILSEAKAHVIQAVS